MHSWEKEKKMTECCLWCFNNVQQAIQKPVHRIQISFKFKSPGQDEDKKWWRLSAVRMDMIAKETTMEMAMVKVKWWKIILLAPTKSVILKHFTWLQSYKVG